MPLLALTFGPEVNSRPDPSSAHLWLDSAVIVTAMTDESTPPTPPLVVGGIRFDGCNGGRWRQRQQSDGGGNNYYASQQ